jgi:23S rRNA (guanosine2251-2'-O)-methyltransferase
VKILAGFHAVRSRLKMKADSVKEIYLDAARRDNRVKDLKAMAEKYGVRIITVEASRIDGMAGGARHQGVVAQAEDLGMPQFVEDVLDALEASGEPPLLLILDGVTDPHNLGACLRVANAAGVHAVVAPKDRAAGISAAVSKVASGAAEVTPYLMVTNLARTIDELKERNIWVVGTDERAEQSLYKANLPEAIAWVLGAEGEGMRRLTREKCDLLVRIPMAGEVGSLNVSVAAGICLFDSVRRRLSV